MTSVIFAGAQGRVAVIAFDCFCRVFVIGEGSDFWVVTQLAGVEVPVS